MKILVINPGSTSTKVAVYNDEKQEFYQNLPHTDTELSEFDSVMEQKDFRAEKILAVLLQNDYKTGDFACIMSRGGMIPPCKSGAYKINSAMLSYFDTQKIDVHISNVGCAIADLLAEKLSASENEKLPAYIYDPVTVDELLPIAKITGMPELQKRSRGHALNTHAMARKCAENLGMAYDNSCFITAHIGGGYSVWLIKDGKSIDMYSDDDSAFAPERCGLLQAIDLVQLCYSGRFTEKEMSKKIRGNAGLKALLGTSDAKTVEERINNGDEKAKQVYEAMAYGIAKSIGALAAAAGGRVDAVILTGGVANSEYLTGMITDRIDWIAPVIVMAGEFEMQALASGGFRVISGKEIAHDFIL